LLKALKKKKAALREAKKENNHLTSSPQALPLGNGRNRPKSQALTLTESTTTQPLPIGNGYNRTNTSNLILPLGNGYNTTAQALPLGNGYNTTAQALPLKNGYTTQKFPLKNKSNSPNNDDTESDEDLDVTLSNDLHDLLITTGKAPGEKEMAKSLENFIVPDTVED